ncbi:hypothetical protein GLOIN_2v1482460 [Rhizophagus clarus]|nr:hypothetical protein GLOIN_2v1482460 [Rhizophagus clarus]
MSEYLNDYAVSYSERAIKSRKESLWKLVNDLITVFGMSDPLSHQLFQEYTPTEMHKEGLSRLFDCYPNGLERIKAVYRQEVLKTEDRNPQGRRTIGVVRTKVKDYNSKKKAEKRKIVIPELTQPVLEDLNETPLTIEPQSKRRKTAGARHRTTEDETAILCALKIYKNYLPEDAIGSVQCFCTYPVWITKNPYGVIDERQSEEYRLLQEFWTKEMENRDPEFIRIMFNMNEAKGVIYRSAFITYAETGRILYSLKDLRKKKILKS